jgi:UDP-glucose 4-epimerase
MTLAGVALAASLTLARADQLLPCGGTERQGAGSLPLIGVAGGGHEVTVLDDLSTGKRDRGAAGARTLVGSVTDAALVRDAMAGVDGCYHLAAVASVPRCLEELVASHRVNIGGFLTLLDAARRQAAPVPFVYASSAAVYGPVRAAAAEDRRPAPISPYGCDKLACEAHATAAASCFGISSVGLRFFNVYGPCQDASSPYAGVISRFVDAAIRGAPIRIFGDGCQTRDFVYVGDAVRAQLLAMAQLERGLRAARGGARVYNVCTGVPTTVNELAAAVCGALGRVRQRATHRPAPAGDIAFSLGVPHAAREQLAFMPTTQLAEGLRLTAGAELQGHSGASRCGAWG